MVPRPRLHRTAFLAAGIYNITWGIFSACDPQWLFRRGWPIIPALRLPGDGHRPLWHSLPRNRPRARGWLIAAVGFSACDPQWLFRFAGMPLANHPGVFACLGMVIGLYGILYLEIARVPERGWLIAAVGLAGKILGPIGLIILIVQGKWPIAAFVICITNDLIWWVPFGLYLKDAWPAFKNS